MIVTHFLTISSAGHPRGRPNPMPDSAASTRRAFSSARSIRMSMSRVARARPQSAAFALDFDPQPFREPACPSPNSRWPNSAISARR